MLNTVYAPNSVTTSETFLWYRADPRLQLGLAYLSRQGAFRALASLRAIDETRTRPSLSLSAGVQGIGTGNPGYSATIEKNWAYRGLKLNAYTGLGVRSNADQLYALGGFKLSRGGWTFGLQHDGIQVNPFVTKAKSNVTLGVYWVGTRSLAGLIGFKF